MGDGSCFPSEVRRVDGTDPEEMTSNLRQRDEWYRHCFKVTGQTEALTQVPPVWCIKKKRRTVEIRHYFSVSAKLAKKIGISWWRVLNKP